MTCPCCGHKMDMDAHRKIDMFMCYECGYIEGRRMGSVVPPVLRFKSEHHTKVYGNNKFSRFMASRIA